MTEIDPIVIQADLPFPIELVWKAITDEAQMRRWYFDAMDEFRPEVGFETEFDVEFEGRVFPHQWRVTEVAEPNKLVYDWCYGGVPGHSEVTWELEESSEGTTLTVTHRGGETFPQDDPTFSRENGISGWNYLIHESLLSFLSGDEQSGTIEFTIDPS
ncbi:MAG: SRPBCC family protein [Planctomycetota bacterium]